MKKYYYLFFLLLSFLGYGQTITWQKNFGGGANDRANSIQKTLDGGYIVVGSTESSATGDVTGITRGSTDMWIVKLTSSGTVTWQKNLGGKGVDEAYSVQQTTDGGYIVVGYTISSATGDVTGASHGGADMWIVKLTSTGTISWQKNLGGSGGDYAYSVQQTTDGGYIVVGDTSSSASGDVTGINNSNFGYSDIWIVKLTSTGTISWQKNLGGNDSELAYSIQQTTDGGYVLAGVTWSSANGNVTGINNGSSDVWIVKLDSLGVISWEKNFGGIGGENAKSIQQTTDGGYILAGDTYSSNSGDVTGISYGDSDIWIIKLNSSGTISWQKNFGGNGIEYTHSIQQTTDGGYVIASYTNSSANGNVTGTNHGNYDMWIVKLSPLGIINWQKNFGGIGIESANSIRQISGNQYIIAGRTNSSVNGDVTGTSKGYDDMWIVKLTGPTPVVGPPEVLGPPDHCDCP